MLCIHENKRTFVKDGAPFFYLADTCWSAFTNITKEEWTYYLAYRKQQGFNTLQINILPQWDACQTPYGYEPFAKHDGVVSYDCLQQDYFQHARELAIQAKEEGFELSLVVLWCNYIPGTWANKLLHEQGMPLDGITTYLDKVHETFSDLHPIYVISGDTDFNEQSTPYYVKAIEYLKPLASQCLFTTHIKGRYDVIPEALDAHLDFYMYQSGHNAQPEHMGMAHRLATTFYTQKQVRPIINSEPCYEQMGYSHHMYGRFQPFDIRKAAWQSVLSGANAGITYGAAGIYSWQKQGMHAHLTSEGFDQPNPWNLALHYPGAWDYGFLKEFAQQHHLEDFVPFDGLIAKSDEIRCAIHKHQTTILIYLPYSTSIKVTLPKPCQQVRLYDLSKQRVAYPSYTQEDGVLTIGMHPFEEDVLMEIECN